MSHSSTLAGGNISRQREVRERRHCDVVSTADARFEHASAPNRQRMLIANVVNLAQQLWPPTRPNLMLMIRHAPNSIAVAHV